MSDERLTTITSLEKNINDLRELKNTARELPKAYMFQQPNQAEERISEIEDQLNEIREGKEREKKSEKPGKDMRIRQVGKPGV